MNQLNISAFETAVAQENLAVRGLRVYRDGALIASYQPQPEERQNQYSCTKSFTSTACAFAIQEGLFALDDYVLDHFRQDAPETVSENLKQMRLRHLITMSMGFESPMLMGAQRPKMTEKDWVKYVLRAPVIHKPGTVFQYNNAGPYLLGILIQRKTGMSLVDYLMPRLFEPLGIPRPPGQHLWRRWLAAECQRTGKAGPSVPAKGPVAGPSADPRQLGRGSQPLLHHLRPGRR